MPCTTILAGRLATADGSTLMARNEDSTAGRFTPKKLAVVNPQDQPGVYTSVLTGLTIPLPDDPMRYSAIPNALPHRGVWGAAGINAANVAMTATETITTNARVLGADPLVANGIGEEDMITVVLPYIRTAREGVERMGMLLEKYGTCESNGMGFQDGNEIWWLETIGGHHWIAKRVPDDAYAVIPNQQGIDELDLTDACGEKKNCMCSPDLTGWISRYHLAVTNDEPSHFDARGAFGSREDSDRFYNTPRAWSMERRLSPSAHVWDGPAAEYTPESDRLPWCLKPDCLITVEDMKTVLSLHMQGTVYDPYGSEGTEEQHRKYRPVGINRNSQAVITQLRPWLPAPIMAVEWVAMASNVFNCMVPFYPNVTRVPEYLGNTSEKCTTESFYWAMRYLGTLADAHYRPCSILIENYQLRMQSEAHALLSRFEDGCDPSMSEEDTRAYLEKCNDEMAQLAKEETYTVLGKVLLEAGNGMFNAYDRSEVCPF